MRLCLNSLNMIATRLPLNPFVDSHCFPFEMTIGGTLTIFRDTHIYIISSSPFFSIMIIVVYYIPMKKTHIFHQRLDPSFTAPENRSAVSDPPRSSPPWPSLPARAPVAQKKPTRDPVNKFSLEYEITQASTFILGIKKPHDESMDCGEPLLES